MKIVAPKSGNVTLGNTYRLMFVAGKRGEIHFSVTDLSKFRYENGYYKEEKRKVTKAGTIRYAGYTIDLNAVDGIQNIIPTK